MKHALIAALLLIACSSTDASHNAPQHPDMDMGLDQSGTDLSHRDIGDAGDLEVMEPFLPAWCPGVSDSQYIYMHASLGSPWRCPDQPSNCGAGSHWFHNECGCGCATWCATLARPVLEDIDTEEESALRWTETIGELRWHGTHPAHQVDEVLGFALDEEPVFFAGNLVALVNGLEDACLLRLPAQVQSTAHRLYDQDRVVIGPGDDLTSLDAGKVLIDLRSAGPISTADIEELFSLIPGPREGLSMVEKHLVGSQSQLVEQHVEILSARPLAEGGEDRRVAIAIGPHTPGHALLLAAYHRMRQDVLLVGDDLPLAAAESLILPLGREALVFRAREFLLDGARLPDRIMADLRWTQDEPPEAVWHRLDEEIAPARTVPAARRTLEVSDYERLERRRSIGDFRAAAMVIAGILAAFLDSPPQTQRLIALFDEFGRGESQPEDFDLIMQRSVAGYNDAQASVAVANADILDLALEPVSAQLRLRGDVPGMRGGRLVHVGEVEAPTYVEELLALFEGTLESPRDIWRAGRLLATYYRGPLTFEVDGENRTITSSLRSDGPISVSTRSAELLTDDILYLPLAALPDHIIDENVSVLIIDARVSGLALDLPAMAGRLGLLQPLELVTISKAPGIVAQPHVETIPPGHDEDPFEGTVWILVDESTDADAALLADWARREQRVTLVGRQVSAVARQDRVDVPDGLVLRFSSSRASEPISVDVPVDPTDEEVMASDPELNAALDASP